MSELAHTNHTEKKDFLVRSSSLKDVRSFCREVFEKLHIDQNLKDELVLAIAEAAQNIVKHANGEVFQRAEDVGHYILEYGACRGNSFHHVIWFKGTQVSNNRHKF